MNCGLLKHRQRVRVYLTLTRSPGSAIWQPVRNNLIELHPSTLAVLLLRVKLLLVNLLPCRQAPAIITGMWQRPG